MPPQLTSRDLRAKRPSFVKVYLLVTAIIFLLVLIAHIARIAAEGTHLLGEPTFLLSSVLSVAMIAWSAVLFKRLPPPHSRG